MIFLPQQRLLHLLARVADEMRRSPTGVICIDRWIYLTALWVMAVNSLMMCEMLTRPGRDLTGDIGFLGGFETVREGYDKEGWTTLVSMMILPQT